MNRSILAALFTAVALLSAGPARATLVHNPVKVSWKGPLVVAEPGKPLTGALEIRVSRPVRIEQLRLAVAGGRGLAGFDVAPVVRVEPVAPLAIPIVLEHGDDAAPLELTYVLEGHPVSVPVDLTPRAIRRATTAGVSVSRERVGRPDAGRIRPLRERSEAHRTTTRLRRGDTPRPQGITGERPGPSVLSNITVTGRVVYVRGDGQERGAEGVRVEAFDEDEGWDEYLAGGTTEPDGSFSLTFNWNPLPWQDDRPDLLIYYETINGHVQVQTSDIIEDNYNWESGVEDDFEGSNYDFGDLSPGDNDDHPALDLCTQVSREWRWFNTVPGYDVATVDVQWPEPGTGAFYVDDYQEIHVASDRNWDEETLFHEYGHHWVNLYAAEDYEEPPYCNGFCDAGGCGHCIWCKETPEIAWGEGFPYWIATVVGRWNQATNDSTPFRFRGFDSLNQCSQDLTSHSPDSTEGHFIALVRDLDDTNEDDNNLANVWMDRVDFDPINILAVVDQDHPLRPLDFLASMKAHFPYATEDLWETAKDIGYEPDATAPGVPTGVSSSSHPTNAPSTNAVYEVSWTRPDDDWSGVAGYSVSFSTGAPALPNATQDIGNVTSYTSAALAPGNNRYFNIRAVDRAGRWSAVYAACGPFSIQAPDPVDLEFRLAAGWDWFIMPRPTSNATVFDVQNPDSLVGNCNCTWWNLAGRNNGGQATGVTSHQQLVVDGITRQSASLGNIAAGAGWSHINRGPVNITGGRHAFEVDLDGTGVLAELDETDNNWTEQWIWSPLPLTAGTSVTRDPPPNPTAGWDAMDPDDPNFYNCDGLRFTTSGWWNAVSIRGLNHDNDWDCRLHVASTGPADGFAANVGWSSRPAGCLDAVLVNKNLTGNGSWDVGVLDFNFVGFRWDYSAVHTTSQTHTFDTEVVLPFAQDEGLKLREFFVSAENIGWVEIAVTTDTPDTPIRARWFDAAFDRGDLDDYDATITTDENGVARMDVNVPGSGYHCVVVFRDPRDGLAPVNVTLRIGKSPPDLMPLAAAGWYAPLVPRPAADGLPGAVPEPDSLYGNLPSTYLNFAVTNTGLNGAQGVLNRFYLDGVFGTHTVYNALAAGGVNLQNSATPHVVRGGRHTLSMVLDPLGSIHERDEANNTRGEQFVWGPWPMGGPVTRGAPPEPSGGFTDVTTGEPLFYNCDGLRTPTYAPAGDQGWWAGAAVMPHTGADVNARLHEPKTGAKLGFESNYAASYWGWEQSDFVLANLRQTALRVFDLGVTRTGPGLASYSAQAVASVYRGVPAGDLGPFTIGAYQIMDLHEFHLTPGKWTFRLQNTEGSVDWGMSLYSPGTPFLGKSMAADSGVAWLAPPGADESITVTAPIEGDYCLAVWKTRSEGLAAFGSYLLNAGATTVGVADGGAAPHRTALAAAYPNPFGSGTNIAFDLATHGPVTLEIFDVRGALVRTLASGDWPAGRHRVAWDGLGNDGRRVPGGVYLVRLAGSGVRSTRKVARLE